MTPRLTPNIIHRKLMNIISDMKQHPEGFVQDRHFCLSVKHAPFCLQFPLRSSVPAVGFVFSYAIFVISMPLEPSPMSSRIFEIL